MSHPFAAAWAALQADWARLSSEEKAALSAGFEDGFDAGWEADERARLAADLAPSGRSWEDLCIARLDPCDRVHAET